MNQVLAAQAAGDRLLELIGAVSTSPATAGVAGLVTAGVLGLSAAGKARNRYASAVAIARFGVTASPSMLVVTFLIAWEAALALTILVSLVVAPAMAAAALGLAAVTFAGFVFSIARSLARGHQFACMCFGSSGTRVSPLALGRAAALAVTASIGALVARAEMTPLDFNEIALCAIVSAGTVSGLALVSQSSQVWSRDDPFIFETGLVPVEGGVR